MYWTAITKSDYDHGKWWCHLCLYSDIKRSPFKTFIMVRKKIGANSFAPSIFWLQVTKYYCDFFNNSFHFFLLYLVRALFCPVFCPVYHLNGKIWHNTWDKETVKYHVEYKIMASLGWCGFVLLFRDIAKLLNCKRESTDVKFFLNDIHNTGWGCRFCWLQVQKASMYI